MAIFLYEVDFHYTYYACHISYKWFYDITLHSRISRTKRMIIYQMHNVISRVCTSMCVFVINAFKSSY